MVVDITTSSIEYKPLHVPPLDQAADVLQKGLSSHFKEVNVSVVDSPDLTAPPFRLSAQGLSGDCQVLAVGGLGNHTPCYKPDKVYDLAQLTQVLDLHLLAAIGAGVFIRQQFFEQVTNFHQTKEGIVNLNQIAGYSEESKGTTLEFLPKDETKVTVMADLLLSRGDRGKVLKVHCKSRKSEENFPTSLRKCLKKYYRDKAKGIGGVFSVQGSKVKHHLPPKEDVTEPFTSADALNRCLKFVDLNPPLLFVGTILTHDMDMDMNHQHFHSYSDHGEGGHYHFDLSPLSVEYLGYFSLAERAVHVDWVTCSVPITVDDFRPPEP